MFQKYLKGSLEETYLGLKEKETELRFFSQELSGSSWSQHFLQLHLLLLLLLKGQPEYCRVKLQ